ncbi:sodium:alanine symporter family protein [Campylobacter sp. RM9344]|uniref:Sodium:alanine symporter family protein n=1 Tax=Campylobacter californiensis TaxID=1032243 RepID=A0AAW3ZU28_9BACT|nr:MULTISPECIES: sodium:alanine symporter family protein [unclassified Campylobacter]MBE2984609.1 sodium:alanine symporter family protein [Campylobacter sp. RM6883]MBE2995103.1 sodium:alanine symporter family protein [Campylobacter sp. RM6913]MBE3029024.1 sodium:alanine symporter family protein [Campylobacter sp. RM9344]MBE3607381.1 sodium:alanine symporter family protein [Campylobacter sp. RM9337]QCD50082.1 Na+/alanine symporter family protein [Campylobacter sp. RM6914]
MELFTELVSKVNSFVWGPYFLITLLCGTGLFFTFRLKFVQIFKFKDGWNRLFGNFSLHGEAAGKDGMSSFQSVATAVAAQVGTGNLVGASTALVMGGPGAIFWMWCAAFLGMATNFAEICLAQVYKTKDDSDHTIGGPAFYISKGIGGKLGKVLAGFFAVAIILALGFMGNMVQANSISDGFSGAFGIPQWAIGLVLAIVCAVVFIGGVKAIARVAEKVVPVMAIIYVIVGLLIVCVNFKEIPSVVSIIFEAAFNPSAAWGGAIGTSIATAMRYGIARGLFSNEAGMGSTPHAHAAAKVKHPVEQGVLGIMSVFVDTFIVLNITVFVVLSSNVVAFENGQPVFSGITLVQEAFSSHLLGHTIGYSFVAICLFFFAFTTILGWYYFAEINVRYLFGKKGVKFLQVLVVAFVFLGSLLKIKLVWELSDLFNGLMVLPNLIAVLLLSPIVVKLLEDYNAKKEYKAEDYIKIK